jgi:hypothetical protein
MCAANILCISKWRAGELENPLRRLEANRISTDDGTMFWNLKVMIAPSQFPSECGTQLILTSTEFLSQNVVGRSGTDDVKFDPFGSSVKDMTTNLGKSVIRRAVPLSRFLYPLLSLSPWSHVMLLVLAVMISASMLYFSSRHPDHFRLSL